MYLFRQQFGEAFEVEVFNFDQTHASVDARLSERAAISGYTRKECVYGDPFEV
jgi:hypothetical protein